MINVTSSVATATVATPGACVSGCVLAMVSGVRCCDRGKSLADCLIVATERVDFLFCFVLKGLFFVVAWFLVQ